MPFVGDTELKPFNLAEIMQNGQMMRARDRQMRIQQEDQQQQQATFARQQQEWNKADTNEANSQAAVKQASTGDYTGADSQYGAGAGQLGIHDVIAGMQDHHRAQVRAQYGAAVPVAIQALQTQDLQARAALIHAAAPSLINAGWKPEDIASFQPTDANLQGLISNARSADDALKLYDAQQAKLNEPYTLGQDQQRFIGGNLIASGPESIKSVNTPEGSTTTIFGGAGHTGIQAPLTVQGLLPLFKAQESSGDYTAVNKSTGAMGAYQVMPATAQALAQKLGISWQPGLMTANSPAAHAYQDKIGAAAIQDSISAGNGNPQAIFSHYYSGSPTAYQNAHGNPKTARYVQDMMGRMGGTAPMTIHGNPKPEDAPPPLDDKAIDYVAQQYAATGQLPPLGMGKQATSMRARIIGRAAVLAQQQGLTGTDAVGVHADTKANTAALVTLQRNANQVLAYERTANANAEQVLQTMGKGAAGTGMPVFNAWVQHGRSQWAGSPDVARFHLAVQTFATEYARVVSGATGGAVTSDSARHEIQSMINSAQTPQQLQAVISQARTEMANRKAGLNDQASALRQNLRGRPEGGGNIPTLSPEQARSAPRGTRFRTADGRVLVRQ